MKFRTGAVSWAHEITGKKLLVGKYFKFYFLKNSLSSFDEKSYELIIDAKSEAKAQQAFELFISALALVEGHVVFPIHELPNVFLYQNGKIDIHLLRPGIRLFQQSGIYRASVIAAKSSFKKIHVYSLSKYLFACSQHSNYIIDLDPFHTEYQKLTKKPLDHLRYSYAILAMYSIIEELGLEIRATEKVPSKLKGEWNPVVKYDLENRLKKSKINLNKRAVWNLRSRPTKIHQRDKLQLQGKASWSSYSIRDSEIEIIDAIAYSSWLRSNVNFLARQLLLDILEPVNTIINGR
jgi:hypothetical protein